MEIKKLILIGASTGGPGQIQKIIKSIKKDFDATIIIAQHMQSSYLASFTKQLDNNCALRVMPSNDNLTLNPKTIYILQESCEIKKIGQNLMFSTYLNPLNYSPNVNLLFNSVSRLKTTCKIMSIVLTGIGDDGAVGSKNLAEIGALCINESEDSSIVYGMPKAASELNPKAQDMDIDEICSIIGDF